MQKSNLIESKLYWGISLVVLIVAVAIINTIVYYASNETVELSSLSTINNLVLSGPPKKQKIEDLSEYQYWFRFSNAQRHFRLHEKYYNYGRSEPFLQALKVGDTLSIQLTPTAMQCYNDIYQEHTVEIVNFSRRSVDFIDLSDRNRLVNARNKKKMQRWWLAGVLGIIAVPLVLLLTSRRRRSNNQAATF